MRSQLLSSTQQVLCKDLMEHLKNNKLQPKLAGGVWTLGPLKYETSKISGSGKCETNHGVASSEIAVLTIINHWMLPARVTVQAYRSNVPGMGIAVVPYIDFFVFVLFLV
jgi:hypothetical protein